MLLMPDAHSATIPRWAIPFTKPARFKSADGGRASTKALRDDTPIPTPTGWTPIGDLQVGDQVLGADGWPVSVTGVYPQGRRPVWEVSFRFADPIYCDGDHLWTAIDHCFRKARNRRGLDYEDWRYRDPATTAQLAERVTHGSREDLNLSIPLSRTLQLPAADLSIPEIETQEGKWDAGVPFGHASQRGRE